MSNQEAIRVAVTNSLNEDIGSGDITAKLIDSDTQAHARVISREPAVICGIDYFNEVFRQLDPNIQLEWQIHEGESVVANQTLVTLFGPARALLTGERCALNWLQCLSGTATQVAQAVNALNSSTTQLLDTRKTIPGLREAQKYAVKIGGGKNHRMGLYDAYLIKENHIASCGSIQKAIETARQIEPTKPVEIEVENLEELKQALDAQADIIMLDNFSLEDMKKAVAITNRQAKLEVSGNVSLAQLPEIAKTGVDYISMGALTKHLHAIDLSMRLMSDML